MEAAFVSNKYVHPKPYAANKSVAIMRFLATQRGKPHQDAVNNLLPKADPQKNLQHLEAVSVSEHLDCRCRVLLQFSEHLFFDVAKLSSVFGDKLPAVVGFDEGHRGAWNKLVDSCATVSRRGVDING